MKCRTISIVAATLLFAVVTSSAQGIYHSRLGRFLERDPAGYPDGMNTYAGYHIQYGGVDPMGLLQRRQVDFLAGKFSRNWPGVGPAPGHRVRQGIHDAKTALRSMYPNAGWDKSKNWKDWRDDIALQSVLDSLIESGEYPNSDLKGFPGQVHKPCGCKRLMQMVQTAKERYRQLGGNVNIDDFTMLAWIAKESEGDPFASAYGNTGSKSSAVGLLQITKDAFNRHALAGSFPDKFLNRFPGKVWDERYLSSGSTNVVTGLFVLEHGTRASGLHRKLEVYKEGPQRGASGGPQYANNIIQGGQWLKNQLHGKDIDNLSDQECNNLLQQLAVKVR